MEILFNDIVKILPYLQLKLYYPYEDMLKEAMSVRDMFVYHRSVYENHRGWKSLCIHGLSPTMTETHENYGYNNAYDAPYNWTNVAPITQEWFQDNFPAKRFFRVRFMLLEAGGFVGKHVDNNRHKMAPINMALNNPLGCRFIMNDTIVPFTNGAAFMLNVSNEHEVINDSNEDRYSIIVHYEGNEQLEKIVEMSYYEHKA